jgi:hypothetical protein
MLVESARYALLRRLAHAMRHQMVVHLQPIGMVSEVLERRLLAAEPNMAQVHDSVAKIKNLSKAAAQDCLDVITWLSPPPGATMAVDVAVQECMALLRSNLSFRGFNLLSEVEAMPQTVARAAARMLLPACLFAMTDEEQGPADVTISARTGEDVVLVEVRMQRTQGDVGFGGELTYRPVQWHEVEAMARSEDVDLARVEGGGVLLSFPVLEEEPSV